MKDLTDRNKKLIYILCPLIVIAFTGHKFYTVLAADFPHELREMTMVVFARIFSEGGSLYSPSVLGRDIPSATNLYGFTVPLIISPFIKIAGVFGASALRVCEIMTLIVECVGTFLAYSVVLRKTRNPVYAMFAAILVDSCYWRYAAFGGAYPDQWGITTGLLLTYLISKDEENGYRRPWLYALIMIFLFFTKQYFFFWAIGVGVYLLLRSVRDFLRYAVSGILFGILSAFAVWLALPLYFTEIFPVAQGSTGNNGLMDSLKQIPEMTLWAYKFIVVAAVVGFIFHFILLKQRKEEAGKERIVSYSYEFCQLVCVLPLCALIARNEGTRYTYYLQLWWPYVILFAVLVMPAVIGRVLPGKTGLGNAFLLLFILLSLWDAKTLLVSRPLTGEQIGAWKEVYSILDEYAGKGEILVSPHLSAFCLERGIETSDYGQAEFNSSDSLKAYMGNRLYVSLFPEAEQIFRENIDYNASVLQNIREHRYSCIALTDNARYWLNDDDILSAGYHVDSVYDLVAGGEELPTVIYVCE